jgi:hypothetical protein
LSFSFIGLLPLTPAVPGLAAFVPAAGVAAAAPAGVAACCWELPLTRPAQHTQHIQSCSRTHQTHVITQDKYHDDTVSNKQLQLQQQQWHVQAGTNPISYGRSLGGRRTCVCCSQLHSTTSTPQAGALVE